MRKAYTSGLEAVCTPVLNPFIEVTTLFVRFEPTCVDIIIEFFEYCGHSVKYMSELINMLLGTGLLINLIKGAELLMTLEQKKKIESHFESATILLDDLEPLKWLELIRSKGFKILLFLFGFLQFLVLAASTYETDIFEIAPGDDTAIFKLILPLLALLTGFCILLFNLKRFNQLIYHFLTSSANPKIFMGKFLLITIALFSIIFFVLTIYIFIPDLIWLNYSIEITLTLLSPFMIYLGAVGMVAGIIFDFYLLIFISALLISVLKWLFWKIATYNKGVFAAILLVVTVMLGFVKVVIGLIM